MTTASKSVDEAKLAQLMSTQLTFTSSPLSQHNVGEESIFSTMGDNLTPGPAPTARHTYRPSEHYYQHSYHPKPQPETALWRYDRADTTQNATITGTEPNLHELQLAYQFDQTRRGSSSEPYFSTAYVTTSDESKAARQNHGAAKDVDIDMDTS